MCYCSSVRVKGGVRSSSSLLLPPFLSDTITTELEALGASFSVHNGVVDIGKVRITRPPEMNFCSPNF